MHSRSSTKDRKYKRRVKGEVEKIRRIIKNRNQQDTISFTEPIVNQQMKMIYKIFCYQYGRFTKKRMLQKNRLDQLLNKNVIVVCKISSQTIKYRKEFSEIPSYKNERSSQAISPNSNQRRKICLLGCKQDCLRLFFCDYSSKQYFHKNLLYVNIFIN